MMVMMVNWTCCLHYYLPLPHTATNKIHLKRNKEFLHIQFLGLVLKKLNLTQQKQTIRKQNGRKTQKASKFKENLNQQSTLITADMCVRIIVYNCRTQYSTEQF